MIAVTLLFILSSCISGKKWESAKVLYSDNTEKEIYVYPSKYSYYNFIKAKEDLNDRKYFLFPENIKSIEGKNFKYIQLFFDEENYGMESYSFGQYLAGNEVIIAKTKFREKTCACKTSGVFFKGYFIISGDESLRIRIDKNYNIKDPFKVYDFFENYSETGLPKDIETINDLISYLKNINN